MEKIPIDKPYDWIQYGDQVFLLKEDDNGNYAEWQADGTSCRQCSITGVLVSKFKTTSKWFNPNWWYKKTCWGNNYPKKIFFRVKKLDCEGNEIFDHKWVLKFFWKKLNAAADEKAIPVEKILKNILREANKKMGTSLRFAFDNTDYGEYWWESYVPVVDEKDNSYVLTWMNCD